MTVDARDRSQVGWQHSGALHDAYVRSLTVSKCSHRSPSPVPALHNPLETAAQELHVPHRRPGALFRLPDARPERIVDAHIPLQCPLRQREVRVRLAWRPDLVRR